MQEVRNEDRSDVLYFKYSTPDLQIVRKKHRSRGRAPLCARVLQIDDLLRPRYSVLRLSRPSVRDKGSSQLGTSRKKTWGRSRV